VTFPIGSAFLPGAEETLATLTLDSEVEGKVIGFSDSGGQPRVFAVVEVVRRLSVIVPVVDLVIAPPDRE
jgi:hypothetical protein